MSLTLGMPKRRRPVRAPQKAAKSRGDLEREDEEGDEKKRRGDCENGDEEGEEDGDEKVEGGTASSLTGTLTKEHGAEEVTSPSLDPVVSVSVPVSVPKRNLFDCVRAVDVKGAAALLSEGVDINCVDDNGNTPLLVLVSLIRKHPDVNGYLPLIDLFMMHKSLNLSHTNKAGVSCFSMMYDRALLAEV